MEDELTDIPAEVEELIEETPVEEVIEEDPVEEVTPELPGEDITPEGSVVPVYLASLTEEELDSMAIADAENESKVAQAEAKEEAKASARAKLAVLGLTEEEVLALIG